MHKCKCKCSEADGLTGRGGVWGLEARGKGFSSHGDDGDPWGSHRLDGGQISAREAWLTRDR